MLCQDYYVESWTDLTKAGKLQKSRKSGGRGMEVRGDDLGDYLERLKPWIGDLRTERTVRGVIEGILGSGTLRLSQIAAFSPLF